MAGPYKVLRYIRNSYEVKLPKSIRIYLIFSPDKLRKANNNPLLGQRNKPPLLIQVTNN